MAISDWSTFFSAEVGASATLAGLVIVAISINLSRILEIGHLPARAAESLFSLMTVFATCSVAIFPGISLTKFGASALVFALLSLAFGARNQWAWHSTIRASMIQEQITSGVLRLASTLPIIAGGAMLVDHAPEGATVVAIGLIVSLAAAMMNAWVLLVEIIR
jgi:modulator of FtsH protease